jgi:hypothetical protein
MLSAIGTKDHVAKVAFIKPNAVSGGLIRQSQLSNKTLFIFEEIFHHGKISN